MGGAPSAQSRGPGPELVGVRGEGRGARARTGLQPVRATPSGAPEGWAGGTRPWLSLGAGVLAVRVGPGAGTVAAQRSVHLSSVFVSRFLRVQSCCIFIPFYDVNCSELLFL